MLLKIEVTEEDIRKGERENCEFCPVALAVKRVLPDITGLDVTGESIEFYTPQQVLDDSGYTKAGLPVEAIKFIHDFDHKESVEPLSFEVETKEVD